MKKTSQFWPIILIAFLVVIFFYRTFFRGLVPIPTDLIVGIYHPWRDHQWPDYPAGVPFKNGLLADIVSIIIPWRLEAIKAFSDGRWPLWLSSVLGGQPLLANFQSAVFSPFNLLFFLKMKEVWAWTAYIVFQPFLAVLFTFLYLRNQKLKRLSSLAGGFVFGFSGFFLVWLEYGIIGHSGFWLPLVFLAIDKLNQKIKPAWFLIGSAAVAASFFGGYPQISLYLFLAGGGYAGFRFWQTKKKQAFLTAVLFLALGVLLASVQLVPGFELLRFSIRDVDITARTFGGGTLAPADWLLLLFPDFFGNPSTLNFWGKTPYNEAPAYISVAGLILAVWGILSSDRRRIFFIALLFLAGLGTLPLVSSRFFLMSFPGLKSASAGRLFFLISFSLAFFSGLGMEAFLKRKKSIHSIVVWLFIIIFGLVWRQVMIQIETAADLEMTANWQVTKRNLILPTLALGVFSLGYFVANWQKAFKKIVSWSFFGLIVLELFRFGWKYNSFSRAEWFYPPTALTDFLKSKIGIDRYAGLVPQSMFIPYELGTIEGYEPLMLKNYNVLTNQINENTFRNLLSGSRWVKVNNFDSALLDLLGVKYFLADRDWQLNKNPQDLDKIFQFGRSIVYENKTVLPRFNLYYQAEVVKNDSREIMRRLIDPSFLAERVILLEEEPILKISPEADSRKKIVLDLESYWQNQPAFQVETSHSGFFYLSDNYYPGWQVFVDGRPETLYRANYSFRAVQIPEGKHEVKFIYQPKSFKIGLIVTLFAGGIIFLIWCRLGRQKD
ncbi:MAG: YfhO family protein [Candidatus Pacebacteria bacterium]|nr:YfhO family protein [Candidatus Paceibacterota bacterium]